MSDALELTFGFDLNHLIVATQRFNLEENEELKSFRNLVIAQKQTEDQAMQNMGKLDDEMIAAIVNDGKALGEPQYKQDGTMTFEFFLESSKVCLKYVQLRCGHSQDELVVLRRQALEEGDERKFESLVLAQANYEHITLEAVQVQLYSSLKVPRQVFEKSNQVYLLEPTRRQRYEEEMKSVRVSLKPYTANELTREQVVRIVKFMEGAKVEAQKRVHTLVRTQQVDPGNMNAVITIEKMKADDRLFKETGLDARDLDPNIVRLQLENDAEIKAIVEEHEKIFEAFLAEKQAEM